VDSVCGSAVFMIAAFAEEGRGAEKKDQRPVTENEARTLFRQPFRAMTPSAKPQSRKAMCLSEFLLHHASVHDGDGTAGLYSLALTPLCDTWNFWPSHTLAQMSEVELSLTLRSRQLFACPHSIRADTIGHNMSQRQDDSACDEEGRKFYQRLACR